MSQPGIDPLDSHLPQKGPQLNAPYKGTTGELLFMLAKAIISRLQDCSSMAA
jgi:hypothetical protein